MIKLVETATFPNGEEKKTEKFFSSRWSLERAFKKSELPFAVLKDLRLYDEAFLKLRLEEDKRKVVRVSIKIEDLK